MDSVSLSLDQVATMLARGKRLPRAAHLHDEDGNPCGAVLDARTFPTLFLASLQTYEPDHAAEMLREGPTDDSFVVDDWALSGRSYLVVSRDGHRALLRMASTIISQAPDLD